MPWKTSNGQYLRAGQSWKDSNGIKHPSNWMVWTEDYKKNTINLTWEEPLGSYDSYYYAGWNSDGDALIPKPLASLQARKLAETKEISKSTLDLTDWYITRKTEANTAIPDEITAYRTAVRTNYAQLKTAISNVSDIDALKALYVNAAGASSEAKTINATSSSVVSTSGNTITISSHGFVNDEKVQYNVGENSSGDAAAVIGGLVNQGIYFIHSAATNTFKLSESHSNCGDEAQIQLSGLSSDGTAQQFVSLGKPGAGLTWPIDTQLKYDGS